MANYKKYDGRLESLVIETKTLWANDVGEISAEDRQWLSRAIHQNPQLASSIEYVRSHTGFTRVITITLDDIQRFYQELSS